MNEGLHVLYCDEIVSITQKEGGPKLNGESFCDVQTKGEHGDFGISIGYAGRRDIPSTGRLLLSHLGTENERDWYRIAGRLTHEPE